MQIALPLSKEHNMLQGISLLNLEEPFLLQLFKVIIFYLFCLYLIPSLLCHLKAPPLIPWAYISRSFKIGPKKGRLICSKNMFQKALKQEGVLLASTVLSLSYPILALSS